MNGRYHVASSATRRGSAVVTFTTTYPAGDPRGALAAAGLVTSSHLAIALAAVQAATPALQGVAIWPAASVAEARGHAGSAGSAAAPP